MNQSAAPLPAGLYLVATPIGNARDITLRALDVLRAADVVAAEDTRTARRLMEIHGIALRGRPMHAYHDHSGPGDRERLVEAVAAGRSVAYLSEAGTPLVADPGYRLVRSVREAGGAVTALPGPSALLAALSVAGMATDRFLFAGFLPPAAEARRRELAELGRAAATLVFYESPRRVADLLDDLAATLGGDRPAAICRELTKLHEEVLRGTVEELREAVATRPPRGEVVLLVGRAEGPEAGPGEVDAALADAMRTMRVKDAATAVAGALGLPRREVYQRALALRRPPEE